jgi:hypothetical protein
VNNIERLPRYRTWLLVLALGSVAAACGKDQIFGNTDRGRAHDAGNYSDPE